MGRELALRYPSSLLAVGEESASAVLASARYAGADYLFYPVIEITATRRGFWQSAKLLKSMRRAALDVRVQVYDVHTGDLIETAVLAARGGLLGGAVSPYEGLERLLAAWI